MKQEDTVWSEKRRKASRILAYHIESSGQDWTSIRDAVRKTASELGISIEKKRRSQLAVECSERLTEMGVVPPTTYLVPWIRNGAPVIRSKAPKRATEARILEFYDSFEWKRLRFAILKSRGRRCECCGVDWRTAGIHVDHIKPLRKRWDLRLDPDNLQVLCEWCNAGKGSKYETDFRASQAQPS